jgi:3-hydroxyisobutyrate dehydrogenase-like beta-hydroxyacid dehydrogenase
MRETSALRVEMPLARVVQETYLAAAAKGVEGLDMTTVIQPMEQRASVEVRRRKI